MYLSCGDKIRLTTRQADRRAKGLSRLLEGMKAVTLAGEMADQIWAHFGRSNSESKGRRRKIVNSVAQTYEAGMFRHCSAHHLCLSTAQRLLRSATIKRNMVSCHLIEPSCRCWLMETERHLGLVEKILRMLKTEQGVYALTSGELQQDHGEREEVKLLFELGRAIGQYGR